MTLKADLWSSATSSVSRYTEDVCGCPPCRDLGASSGLVVPRDCNTSWSGSTHLLQPGCPSPGPVFLLPCCPLCCSRSHLPSPWPMCPAHPAANGLAHACAVGAAAVLQVTAVSLRERCSPSVLPACSGWLREEGLRCTKAFNGSHEPVNINYLQAHPPEAEQSRRRR